MPSLDKLYEAIADSRDELELQQNTRRLYRHLKEISINEQILELNNTIMFEVRNGNPEFVELLARDFALVLDSVSVELEGVA